MKASHAASSPSSGSDSVNEIASPTRPNRAVRCDGWKDARSHLGNLVFGAGLNPED
jgi:hypothetical protein